MLLTVMAAWLYALVTGWGAPCVRSVPGLTLFMVCGYFYRKRRPLNLLAAVALAFLVCDPDQLFDASFQLTFLAVAFLGAFASPLRQATSGPLPRAPADSAADLPSWSATPISSSMPASSSPSWQWPSSALSLRLSDRPRQARSPAPSRTALPICLPGLRPRSALRCQLPARLPGSGLPRRFRFASQTGHVRPARPRPRGPPRYRPRPQDRKSTRLNS